MTASLSVGTTSSNLVDVPVEPDAIGYSLQDISAADAGRVNDTGNTMYKMKTSQKRKLQLVWVNIAFADASTILQMFDPEYFFVKFKDVKTGGWLTKEFYAGDRSAPFKQIALVDANGRKTIISSLSFDIIER